MASSSPDSTKLLSKASDFIAHMDDLRKENALLKNNADEPKKIVLFVLFILFIVLYTIFMFMIHSVKINDRDITIDLLNSQIKNLTISNNKTLEDNSDLAALQEKYSALEEKYLIANNNLANKTILFKIFDYVVFTITCLFVLITFLCIIGCILNLIDSIAANKSKK